MPGRFIHGAAPPGEHDRLIATARRALACDAVVVRCDENSELPASPVPGWTAVLSAEASYEGQALGSIHALQRTSETFQNPDLIEIYAEQLGLHLALRGHQAASTSQDAETLHELDELLVELAAMSVADMRTLSERLNEIVAPAFGGARTGIMLADDQRNVLQLQAGGFGMSGRIVACHRLSRFDLRCNAARVLQTGWPSMTNAADGDRALRQTLVQLLGVSRMLTVPLRDLGTLHIADPPQPFVLDDLARAMKIAPRVADIAGLGVRLFRQRRDRRLAETLAGASLAVACGEPTATVVPRALRDLAQIADANLLALVPYDGEPTVFRQGERDAGLESTVLDDAEGTLGLRAFVSEPKDGGDPGWAAYYVPTWDDGRRLGTLAALRMRGEPFDGAERDAFEQLANIAASASVRERSQRQRVEAARLEERRRIADDLHDDVAQLLFAARLGLEDALADDDLTGRQTAPIERARSLLVRGDASIRRAIDKLYAPPAADVAARLSAAVATVGAEFLIEPRLEVDPIAADVAHRLDDRAVDAVLRVARESLVNSAKHAGPCRRLVRLDVVGAAGLRVTVADDGRGMNADTSSNHGLASLRDLVRERGGELRLRSAPGSGTRVQATFAATAQPWAGAGAGTGAPVIARRDAVLG